MKDNKKQIKSDAIITYKLVVTIRQFVDGKQNLVCYDGLVGQYSSITKALDAAKEIRKQQ